MGLGGRNAGKQSELETTGRSHAYKEHGGRCKVRAVGQRPAVAS